MPLKTLNTLLRVVIEQGYPIEHALQHIGLDFDPLTAAPETLPAQIPTESYSKLYRLLMKILQDEAFCPFDYFCSSIRKCKVAVAHSYHLIDADERRSKLFCYWWFAEHC